MRAKRPKRDSSHERPHPESERPYTDAVTHWLAHPEECARCKREVATLVQTGPGSPFLCERCHVSDRPRSGVTMRHNEGIERHGTGDSVR